MTNSTKFEICCCMSLKHYLSKRYLVRLWCILQAGKTNCVTLFKLKKNCFWVELRKVPLNWHYLIEISCWWFWTVLLLFRFHLDLFLSTLFRAPISNEAKVDCTSLTLKIQQKIYSENPDDLKWICLTSYLVQIMFSI